MPATASLAVHSREEHAARAMKAMLASLDPFVKYLFSSFQYPFDMDLRQLRYFVAVAEELSFTRAAQRLYMAQPPLSNQVLRLERALDVKLFDRSRRAIRLTAAGEALLPEARRLLVQAEQTASMVQRVGHGEVGQLTIGFVPSASNATLPAQLRAFRSRYPDVALYLREMRPDELVRHLLAGGVDVSFLFLPFADPGLETMVVSQEPLVAALPADHRLCKRARIRVADLAGEPFVLPARHQMPGLFAQVQEACRDAGFAPGAVQKDVWLMQTIIGLVAGGIGVALVPASVENLHRAGVEYRALRGVQPTVELGAVWRRRDSSPALHCFLEVVGELRA